MKREDELKKYRYCLHCRGLEEMPATYMPPLWRDCRSMKDGKECGSQRFIYVDCLKCLDVGIVILGQDPTAEVVKCPNGCKRA